MAAKAVSISSFLIQESFLLPLVKVGMGAMKPVDLQLIAESERRSVKDSLDLDEATRELFPNQHRWDYIISHSRVGQLIGIEPHTANDGEVSVVVAKKKNAVGFLRGHLPPHHKVAKWLWVSHGRVGFSKMDRIRRVLDQNGIAFVGRYITEL